MAARMLRFIIALSLLSSFLHPVSVNAEDTNLPEHIFLPIVLHSINATSGGTPAPTCLVLWQSPADGSVLQAGSAFRMHWSIQNTSPSAWQSDRAVIRFVSGDRLQAADSYDLPFTVAPGGSVMVSLDMLAPSIPGTFTANWAILQDQITLCSFYSRIRVP